MLLENRFALVIAVALVCAAVSGCASDGSKDGSGSATAAGGGMVCPTCQTVWTFDTVGQGSKVQRLEAKPGMTCPDCDAMAVAYSKGEANPLHNCDMCKVTPTVLKPGAAPLHPRGTHSPS